MILVDLKNDAKTSSAINLPISDDEPTLSFAELLKGVSSAKSGDKDVKKPALLLSLEDSGELKTDKNDKTSSKANSLLSLLKNEETKLSKDNEIIELHPKLSTSLDTKELKTLISEAKEYLRSKIMQSDDYQKTQIKELPKTIKGLATLAKKLKIDITKITIEDVKIKDTSKLKAPLRQEIKIEDKQVQHVQNEDKKSDLKTLLKGEKSIKNSSEIKDEDKPVEVKAKNVQIDEPIDDIQHKPKKAIEREDKAQNKEIKANITENKTVEKKTLLPKQQPQDVEVKDHKHEIQNRSDNKELKASLEQLAKTPIFKAQSKTEVTTEQIVQVKASSQIKVEQKTPKEKADETLKLLLRGEKPNNSILTADFSVETARVIAPSATTEAKKSLESLLHGDSSNTDESVFAKSEHLTTHKADSFEVKLNEAKQMIKYISQDIKTAIDDYKSPFTRVKVQLNPQKLGEVELTVVQRGKNLHVNLSSNNAAINALSMNANELRVQLNNNGINNASLNFSNNSQNGDSTAGGQQQHRDNEQRAHKEYNYFEEQEANEEILNSLEIVVPQYG